ncbi:MFS transporter [Bisbaumannia pacifica]|uniref:MFS transporter n=1 Tax=Bisbaumannia pacifica TaxID=77098 RepID=A0A510XGR2_9GAMM|nr:MFS transporter [Halomonas pacifica]MBH8579689.1 MFS transporter [Halomonas pacifica]GEK48800.1 MFS transporter [Halomonas pacifica]
MLKRLFEERLGDEGLGRQQRRMATLVVVLATLLAVLDLGIVNIALPSLASSLGVEESQAVWVATTYQLVCAASLLSFAALSRLVGQWRVFTCGLVIYSLGALGAALAPDLELLLVWRVVQGLGGAAILSLGPSLYRNIFPRRLLGRAIGLNAMVVAFGLASGPTLGGVVLTLGNWPWVFALNVPVGLVAIGLAWRVLPYEQLRHGGFDWLGALLSVLVMGGLVLTMERLGHGGHYLLVSGLGVLSLLSMAVFVWWQRRTSTPLVPLSLFEAPRFASASIVTVLAFTAQGAAFIALPFLYQGVMGVSPLDAALFFTPWPLALLVSGAVAGRLADKRDPALLVAGGLGLFLCGMVGLGWLSTTGSAVYLLIPSLLCGLGYGFFQAPNNREIMGSAPLALSANASGVLASLRTFGQCLGSALVALVMALPFGNVTLALWLAAVLALLALLASVLRLSQPVQLTAT